MRTRVWAGKGELWTADRVRDRFAPVPDWGEAGPYVGVIEIVETNHMAPSDQFAKSSWMLASIAVVIAALYLAKGVLVPLTLAVLLSFLLSPVCDWLERRRLGRIPGGVGDGHPGLHRAGHRGLDGRRSDDRFGPQNPRIPEQYRGEAAVGERVCRRRAEQGDKNGPGNGPESLADRSRRRPTGDDRTALLGPRHFFAGEPAASLWWHVRHVLEVLGTTGIVIVLVVFFLVRREDLRDRFIHLVGKGHVTVTTQMLEDAGARVSRYLSMLFLINATFGISVGIGLYLIGVPNAILWGILAAALRFIPYIGPWIAAAMPIGLSMAISTGWVAPLLTVGLFVVLELFNNNVLEPWLYGKNTGVSAVAVLVAAVFWMWLWGPVGLLLATPLTVCVLVVGKHVPQLSFLDILLGNEPVFEPKKRIYQRLLAGDQEEAAELLDELSRAHSRSSKSTTRCSSRHWLWPKRIGISASSTRASTSSSCKA